MRPHKSQDFFKLESLWHLLTFCCTTMQCKRQTFFYTKLSYYLSTQLNFFFLRCIANLKKKIWKVQSCVKTPFLYCLMTNPKWSINRTWSFIADQSLAIDSCGILQEFPLEFLLEFLSKKPKSFKMPIGIRKDYLKKFDNFNCGLPWSIPELKPQI